MFSGQAPRTERSPSSSALRGSCAGPTLEAATSWAVLAAISCEHTISSSNFPLPCTTRSAASLVDRKGQDKACHGQLPSLTIATPCDSISRSRPSPWLLREPSRPVGPTPAQPQDTQAPFQTFSPVDFPTHSSFLRSRRFPLGCGLGWAEGVGSAAGKPLGVTDSYTMTVAPQPTALEAEMSPSVHREFLA